MEQQHLLSFKPYLFNAYYNWFIDSGITPHLSVNTSVKGVVVPQEYVKNNHIVLSIAPTAIADYHAGKKAIFFKAMFSGQSKDIVVPYEAMEDLIAVQANMGLPVGQALRALDMGNTDEDDEDEMPDFTDDYDDASYTEEEGDDSEGGDAGFEFVSDDYQRK